MNKVWLIPLVAIIAVSIFSAGYLFSIWGFTTLSLTKADFRVGDTLPDGTFWNDELWILEVSQSQLGHRASGIITPGEVGSESGETPEQSFYIEMELTEQNCEYPLSDEEYATPISKFHLEYWDVMFEGPCTDVEIESRCPNALFSGIFDTGVNALKPKCYCVDESRQAMAVDPNIENPYTRTVGSVSVGNDESGWDYMNIDTQQADRIRGFINPYVFMSWEGYHSTDFQCPSQNELFAYESMDSIVGPTISWKVGFRNNYDTYKQRLNGLEADIIALDPDCGLADCRNEAQRLVDAVNDASDVAMEVRSTDGYGNAIAVDGPIIVRDILNANQDPKLIKIPQYVFYVKADWLGIEVLRPDIKIVSANQIEDCFRDSGTVSVTLRNDGETGSASLSVRNCPGGISGGTATLDVNGGGTASTTISLSSSVSQKTAGTCELVSNDGYHTDTRSFSVCALPNTVECTPGELRCIDGAIKKCNQEATGWEMVEDCTLAEKCEEGQTGKCSQATGTPECICEGGGGGDDECGSFWDNPIGWILCKMGEMFGDMGSFIITIGLLAFGLGVIILIIIILAAVLLLRSGGSR